MTDDDLLLQRADIVITDHTDMHEYWERIDNERQDLLTEDGFTKGKSELNLIAEHPDEGVPAVATQLGYHVLKGQRVLDLREDKNSFADMLAGLTEDEDRNH